MHLPSQLKTNELVPSIIQKNINIFLSAKKRKDISNVCTCYPFPGVLIVEGSAQRKALSGEKRAEERRSPPSLQSFPGSLYFEKTRRNFKSNLILVVVRVVESKGL